MAFYPEFAQQPFKPHQCIHINSEGNRCGAYALRNNYNCYHHQSEDMPTVVPNEAFPIESVQDRDAIQIAIGEVLFQLAANQMDAKRASVLLYGLQVASSNLPPHARPARQLAARSAEAAETSVDTRVEPLPLPPERDYNPEEKAYLRNGVSIRGFDPGNFPRPASVTDDDIINVANHCRRRTGLPLQQPKRNANGALIAIHEHPNRPENQIAPAATLPTIQAVADPHEVSSRPRHPNAVVISTEVASRRPEGSSRPQTGFRPHRLRVRIDPCSKRHAMIPALAAEVTAHRLSPSEPDAPCEHHDA